MSQSLNQNDNSQVNDGGWIQTYSGGKFWIHNPRWCDVNHNDIAQALSNVCRFGGHCKTFYSVAQHSCLVSDQCQPENQLWGLLHDAPEAYLVDLPRPFKLTIRNYTDAFDVVDDRLMGVIREKYDLGDKPDEVKHWDTVFLTTEARDLMAPLVDGWSHTPENGYEILPERIITWSPGRARSEFLLRFHRLTNGKYREKEVAVESERKSGSEPE